MSHGLYSARGVDSDTLFNNEPYNVLNFRPNLFKLSPIKSESISFRNKLNRFLWTIVTLNKLEIYYVICDDMIVHTSYVIPKCFKFSFLAKNEYEIGPCQTMINYRGRGIYPQVLNKIRLDYGVKTKFYMLISNTNISSIKGASKAYFIYTGTNVYKKNMIWRLSLGGKNGLANKE